MIYPKKLNSKKSEKALNILIIISIALAISLIIINKLTTPAIHWSALANCGIVYVWITIIYSIKKSINIAEHVLLQTIAMSLVVFYTDYRIGFKGWSIDIAFPIILIGANATMLILTIVSRKEYIKYAICQLIVVFISFIPITLIIKDVVEMKLLSIIAIFISILNFTISIILCYKDVKEAIISRLHM